MDQDLLNQVVDFTAVLSTPRGFFKAAYANGKFLWAVTQLAERRSCGIDEQWCFFPDLSDPDPIYHFEGVAFDSLAGDTVVSEAECLAEMRRACEQYIDLHPSEEERVRQLLAACQLAR